ncbi:hypothetical protein ACFPK9_13250 [Rubritalea spongiae]|uniref:Uncharacterized protein n=1 Tax=Rubritalea spongiae TaxID=430797 RepID=A0ABW5E384_9BACT
MNLNACATYAIADYNLQTEELEAAGLDKVWSLKPQSGIQYASDLLSFNDGKFAPAS